MITVGLVVEGPHDYLLLMPLISAELRKRYDQEVRFKELQPEADQTGSYSGGGWPRVVAWCKDNAGERLNSYFTPLFEGDPPCDAIVVHMDGDALEHLGPHTSRPRTAGSKKRVASVRMALSSWLQVPGPLRTKLAIAIPVLQTEAWILCSEKFASNCDAHAAKDVFRSTYRPKDDGSMASFYKKRAEKAAAQLHEIENRSGSFQAFQKELGAIVLPE